MCSESTGRPHRRPVCSSSLHHYRDFILDQRGHPIPLLRVELSLALGVRLAPGRRVLPGGFAAGACDDKASQSQNRRAVTVTGRPRARAHGTMNLDGSNADGNPLPRGNRADFRRLLVTKRRVTEGQHVCSVVRGSARAKQRAQRDPTFSRCHGVA